MAELDAELHFLLDEYKKSGDESATQVAEAAGSAPRIQLSVRFTGSPDELSAAGMDIVSVIGVVAYGQASLAALATLNELDSVISIEKLRRKHLTLDNSVPDVRANQVWSRSGDTFTKGGAGVIIGIVDTGIDFEHLNFRKPNGDTRLLRIWDQTLNIATGDHPPGPVTLPIANSPQPTTTVPLGYGVEYTEQQINEYLHNPTLVQPVRQVDQHGHGTHVAGIAAGSGAQSGGCHRAYHYVGMAPAADIIAVRKWGLTDGDAASAPTGATDTMIDAILYIINVAKTLPTPKPVVINLSMGGFTGRMNGLAHNCVTMDNLLQANTNGLSLVFGAGNAGDRRFHAVGTVPAGPTATLSVGLTVGQQDNKTRTIDITYTGNNLSIQLTSGIGTSSPVSSGWIAPGGPTPTTPINGLGRIAVVNAPNRILILIRPPSTPPVPPATTPTITGNNRDGNWTIELRSATNVVTPVEAYCLNGMDLNVPFFTKPPEGQPDLVVSRGTLNEEAATKGVLSVGAYSTATGALADFSGRDVAVGPTQKPEITAPGVGIFSTANATNRAIIQHDEDCDCCVNCCCTCCQDFYITKEGTSMAAPHVAGAVALLFQKDKTRTHTQIKTHITASARPVATTVLDDQLGWGAGKLNAKAAYDDVHTPTLVTPPAPQPTPFAALPQSHREQLQDRLMRHPRWPEFRTLYDRYADELRSLINTNKRVATVWHRCGGPAWVRVGLQLASMPTMPIPDAAGGCTLQNSIDRMRAIITQYGSPALLGDIDRYSPMLALVESGQSLLQLVNLVEQATAADRVNTYQATQ